MLRQRWQKWQAGRRRRRRQQQRQQLQAAVKRRAWTNLSRFYPWLLLLSLGLLESGGPPPGGGGAAQQAKCAILQSL